MLEINDQNTIIVEQLPNPELRMNLNYSLFYIIDSERDFIGEDFDNRGFVLDATSYVVTNRTSVAAPTVFGQTMILFLGKRDGHLACKGQTIHLLGGRTRADIRAARISNYIIDIEA